MTTKTLMTRTAIVEASEAARLDNRHNTSEALLAIALMWDATISLNSTDTEAHKRAFSELAISYANNPEDLPTRALGTVLGWAGDMLAARSKAIAAGAFELTPPPMPAVARETIPKTRAPKFAPITPEQAAALADYATAHGRTWKAQLGRDWMAAGSRWSGPYHLLHQLRNSHGPKWLDGYKLGQ